MLTHPVGFFGGVGEPTDWVQIGNDLNITGVNGNPALAALSSTRIAFIDAGKAGLPFTPVIFRSLPI